MPEYYDYRLYENHYRVTPYRSAYSSNDTLAVILMEDTGEPFGKLTVNLMDSDKLADGRTAFVDTNNLPGAEEFLTENRLAVFTGIRRPSGWCSYPLYRFDLDRIPPRPEDGDR